MTPLGDGAWRLDLPDAVDRRALVQALRAVDGVEDVIVAERHVAVTFAPGRPPLLPPLDQFRGKDTAAARRHEIAVRYDGEDLDELARTVGGTREEIISLHAGAVYTVTFLGFLPGFAYLSGGSLVVPRRSTPRTRVPAGSVAIAGPYTGVYPFASPGGWHLVGRTDFTMFDRERGATLAAGDRVAFRPA